MKEQARRVLRLLDLTSLGSSDQPEDIVQLCRHARSEHGAVASVCVWPRFVPLAVEELADSGVLVCAVANFPQGDNDHVRAVADARRIVDGGGDEVDVVVPWRALAEGDEGVIRELVAAVRTAVGESITLKAILETGELSTAELIHGAGAEAIAGGADFLKTSTGKTEHAATPAAASVLLDLARDHQREGSVGVKISGGVRDLDTANRYLSLADATLGPEWATVGTFRFGASGLLNDLLLVLDG